MKKISFAEFRRLSLLKQKNYLNRCFRSLWGHNSTDLHIKNGVVYCDNQEFDFQDLVMYINTIIDNENYFFSDFF